MATPDATKWTQDDWDRFKEMNKDFYPDIKDMLKEINHSLDIHGDVARYYIKHYGEGKEK